MPRRRAPPARALWLAWLLGAAGVLAARGAVAAAREAQQPPPLLPDAAAGAGGGRGLAAGETELFCNVTSECRPCLAKHMDSEACRPTRHAEHLSCATDEAQPHQVKLALRRRGARKASPVHLSRSCRPPGDAAGAPAGASADANSSSNSSSSSSSGAAATAAEPAALTEHSEPPDAEPPGGGGGGPGAGVSVGGLNLLYFELAMAAVLAGALPLVRARKRRYVRL
ncbi:hypothetical protein HT031_003551 [Scenedesmus sp. PABB004]|nr:hypothetical protein HT031_003551 [Scenedesmus sp. PABB004]